MPQCSVYGCTRMGGHKFPKYICVKKLWVLALNRQQIGKVETLWQPGIAARVCSRHFSAQDYEIVNRCGKKTWQKATS